VISCGLARVFCIAMRDITVMVTAFSPAVIAARDRSITVVNMQDFPRIAWRAI
jgi:hypothetical protein